MADSKKNPAKSEKFHTLVYMTKKARSTWGFNDDDVEQDIEAYLEIEKQQAQEVFDIQEYLNNQIIELEELNISPHLQLEAQNLIQNLLDNLTKHPEQDGIPHREIADATLLLLKQIPKQLPKYRKETINNYKLICQQHCEKIPEGKESILKALAKLICGFFGNRFKLFEPKPFDRVDLIVKKASKTHKNR